MFHCRWYTTFRERDPNVRFGEWLRHSLVCRICADARDTFARRATFEESVSNQHHYGEFKPDGRDIRYMVEMPYVVMWILGIILGKKRPKANWG